MAFWLPRSVPFIQFASSVARIFFWESAFTGCPASGVSCRDGGPDASKPDVVDPTAENLGGIH